MDMMAQNTLFDLDEIPMLTPEQKAADNRRWYITKPAWDGNGEVVLTATHIDELEWKRAGSFKHQPHLYKTWGGAYRQGHYYCGSKDGVDNFTVREWKGW
jgi:hypothetical protein